MAKRAIVVEIDGASRAVEWPLSLKAMQNIVAGDEQTDALIEYVPRVEGMRFLLPDGRMARMRECIVNEEGLLLDLPYNIGASIFANGGSVHGPYRLVGNAIIVYDEPTEKATKDNEKEREERSLEYITQSLTEVFRDGLPQIPEPEWSVIRLGGEEE